MKKQHFQVHEKQLLSPLFNLSKNHHTSFNVSNNYDVHNFRQFNLQKRNIDASEDNDSHSGLLIHKSLARPLVAWYIRANKRPKWVVAVVITSYIQPMFLMIIRR